MAFIDEYKPSSYNWPRFTLTDVQRLADTKIEMWNGSIETTDTGRTRPRGSLMIVVDPNERHLRPKTRGSGELVPAAGVLIVAALDDRPQLHEFVPSHDVSADVVETVVDTFKRLLRPTVELAARTYWAIELAELRMLQDYAERNPTAVEVHRHRYPGTPFGQVRVDRIRQLGEWLTTPELYPIKRAADARRS